MKIEQIMKYDYDSYFYPIMYYFVIYDDGSYTLLEGDNLKYIEGKNNPNIIDNFPNKEEIPQSSLCNLKYSKQFYDVLEKYDRVHYDMATRIRQKLRINTSNFSNLYYYKPGDKFYDKIMKEYKKVLSLFKRKCLLSGIKYEKDTDKMIKNITEMIDAKIDPRVPSFKNDVSFCYSIDAIKKEYEKWVDDINSINDVEEKMDKISSAESKFQSASINLALYTREFFGLDNLATIALSSKDPKDKELIKKYTEFLVVLPKYMMIKSYVESCIDKFQYMRQDIRNNAFNNNEEFLKKIDDMIEHNTDEDMYLYHVTQSEYDANKIINEGLFMYSDSLESTTYPELNREELLEHGYGNSYQMYENYIMVIDMPKDTNIVRKLTEEEKNNADVMPRRIGITSKPSYVIDSEYIVGYIDKKNMDVIINPNYKKNVR